MPNNASYQNKSILDVLTLADEKQLLIPDIQRDYVWEISQIEELFESILQDYPIGSFIFWKTSRNVINQNNFNLSYFFKDFNKEDPLVDKISGPLPTEHDYYIVLDGQQRITSLYIALYGSYTYFSSGKNRKRNDPKYLRTKELYYNLDFHKTHKEGDENKEKRFCFLTEEEASAENRHYFKIKNLLKYKRSPELMDALDNQYSLLETFGEKARTDIRNNLDMLFSQLSVPKMIHYFCLENMNYDDALDIFVRINSSGTPLSKADLLFSTLINNWKKVKKEDIVKFLKNMNANKTFQFSKDYLMRFSLLAVGADTSLKITSFKQDIVEKIRENWEKIKKALMDLSKTLQAIELYHPQILSYNATMAIAYYIFKGGNINLKNKEALKNVKKYLWIAFAKNLFAGASDTSLNNIRNAIDNSIKSLKSDFPLEMFYEIRLSGGRNFSVDESDLEDWLTHKKGEDKVFLILSLLYPNLKLNEIEFHQDHCHPATSFSEKNLKKIGLSDEQIKEWQQKKDYLPNLQLLEGSKNQSKKNNSLKKWVETGNKLEYCSKNISLELSNFDKFFQTRRKLMKAKLMEIFEVSVSDKNNN